MGRKLIGTLYRLYIRYTMIGFEKKVKAMSSPNNYSIEFNMFMSLNITDIAAPFKDIYITRVRSPNFCTCLSSIIHTPSRARYLRHLLLPRQHPRHLCNRTGGGCFGELDPHPAAHPHQHTPSTCARS